MMMLTIWMMMTMVQLQVCDNQERGSRANNPHIMERPLPHWKLFLLHPLISSSLSSLFLMLWFFGGFFWKVLPNLVQLFLWEVTLARKRGQFHA